jgi:hypothetical protein
MFFFFPCWGNFVAIKLSDLDARIGLSLPIGKESGGPLRGTCFNDTGNHHGGSL